MRKLLLLAVLALSLFAAVPSHAECGGFGSIYVCEDTNPDYTCTYSNLAVTGHYSCAYIDDLNFNYFWLDVYGDQHYFDVDAWPEGVSFGVHVAGEGLCGYVNDSPDFGGGSC